MKWWSNSEEIEERKDVVAVSGGREGKALEVGLEGWREEAQWPNQIWPPLAMMKMYVLFCSFLGVYAHLIPLFDWLKFGEIWVSAKPNKESYGMIYVNADVFSLVNFSWCNVKGWLLLSFFIYCFIFFHLWVSWYTMNSPNTFLPDLNLYCFQCSQ